MLYSLETSPTRAEHIGIMFRIGDYPDEPGNDARNDVSSVI